MSGNGTSSESVAERQDHNDQGEETTDVMAEFTRLCLQIIERYQTGQIKYPDALVQLALEMSKVEIAPDAVDGVVRHFYEELERVKASLIRNSQSDNTVTTGSPDAPGPSRATGAIVPNQSGDSRSHEFAIEDRHGHRQAVDK